MKQMFFRFTFQVRNDLKAMGCSAMLDKYDSYTVKVCFLMNRRTMFDMNEPERSVFDGDRSTW